MIVYISNHFNSKLIYNKVIDVSLKKGLNRPTQSVETWTCIFMSHMTDPEMKKHRPTHGGVTERCYAKVKMKRLKRKHKQWIRFIKNIAFFVAFGFQ